MLKKYPRIAFIQCRGICCANRYSLERDWSGLFALHHPIAPVLSPISAGALTVSQRVFTDSDERIVHLVEMAVVKRPVVQGISVHTLRVAAAIRHGLVGRYLARQRTNVEVELDEVSILHRIPPQRKFVFREVGVPLPKARSAAFVDQYFDCVGSCHCVSLNASEGRKCFATSPPTQGRRWVFRRLQFP